MRLKLERNPFLLQSFLGMMKQVSTELLRLDYPFSDYKDKNEFLEKNVTQLESPESLD